ncbi:MAG: DsbA family protein [Myxococcales bacterium]|nr:DsbA family protein [Myxococcales bacterium]MBK7195505.1 DsbA family protein [Myxococcales bacterium]MBP6848654.1 DsbA family protein [Kofleriaceae bacterium]
MSSRSLAAAAVALSLVACRPAPGGGGTAELAARLDRVEARLDIIAKTLGGESTPDGPPASDPVRLARVEAKLGKIVAFLKQAVPAEVDDSRTYAIPVDPDDLTLGPADAAVTIVEAYEYLCPYCAMVAPTIDQLRARYPKDVRVVGKYMVIHGEPARPAGLAACAAGRQGKLAALGPALWAAIWPTSGQIDRSQAEVAAVEQAAKAAGVNLTRYRADVADPGACTAWIERSAATLTQFGAGGTPSFWINGKPFDGRDLDAFSDAVEAELAAVKASGIAPGRYYQEVVLGKGEPAAVMISPFD